MNYLELVQQIADKKSFLCVGLDPDLKKMPAFLTERPLDEAMTVFCCAVVDATAPYAVAFKPNFAFFESAGIDGLKALAKTITYIKDNYPEIMVIADAKRGDIGNSSKHYAEAVFEGYRADAVTVAPYMGHDSVEPFLSYPNKWTVVLALTSNEGSTDFQTGKSADGEPLYQKVLRTSSLWGSEDNMMYVIGATHAEMLFDVRNIVPKHFLLIPGVGAQGGSLQKIARYGINADFCGLLVNASRSIIYAGRDEKYAEAAAQKAAEMQEEMSILLQGLTNLVR